MARACRVVFGTLDQFVKFGVEFDRGVLCVFRNSHFGDPFAFGRSTRCSRNSGGPLVRRRRRCARSSDGAAGSIIFSIVLAASSAARSLFGVLRIALEGRSALRASSTSRRMASGRPGRWLDFGASHRQCERYLVAIAFRFEGLCRSPAARVIFWYLFC